MDLLNEKFINSLPQPLWVKFWGRKDFDWPLWEICVETGLLKIDVCGKLDNHHVSDVKEFRDDSGKIYSSDEFYLEEE